MTTTTIELLRHGEPEGGDCMRGSIDVALTPLGWEQMNQAIPTSDPYVKIISSTLCRCADFATTLSQKTGKPLSLSEQWREIDFGDWDGRSYQDLHNDFPQDMHNFFIDPANNTPPNGESLADFSQRVETALLSVLQQHQGKRIALFVHSGVIRTLIAWCLKIDYLQGVQFQRIKIDYASISHISVFAHEGEHFPQLCYTNKVADSK